MTPPNGSEHSRSGVAPGFGRRLAVYLFGVAIGLMLLGLVQRMRAASRPPAPAPAASGGDATPAAPGNEGEDAAPRPGDEQDG